MYNFFEFLNGWRTPPAPASPVSPENSPPAAPSSASAINPSDQAADPLAIIEPQQAGASAANLLSSNSMPTAGNPQPSTSESLKVDTDEDQDLKDVELSSDNEEDGADDTSSSLLQYGSPPSFSASPPSQLNSAAAASSAPSPTRKEAAEKFDEAKAKAAISILHSQFAQAKIIFENSCFKISEALNKLPPKPLYQSSGKHEIWDKIDIARKKAEEMLFKLKACVNDANQATELSSSKLDGSNLVPQEYAKGTWDYIKITGTALAVTGLVAGSGALALGTFLASMWGVVELTTVISGTIGVLNSVPATLSLVGGGALAGGVAGNAHREIIQDKGGINALLNALYEAQVHLDKILNEATKKVGKLVKKLDALSKDCTELKSMLIRDILSIQVILEDQSDDSMKSAMNWLKKRAAEYSKFGEDFPTAILAYSFVHPSSICRAGFELNENERIFFASFQHSDEQKELFGSISLLASWLYRKPVQKLDFLFNMAIRFMEINCTSRSEEFTDEEYLEWCEIAGSLADEEFTNPIEFDLNAARRLGIEDRILVPVIAMKKYQIKHYIEQNNAVEAESYLDAMVKEDAVKILQSKEGDILNLLARAVKIYEQVFDVSKAEKYITVLVYTIIDPNGSISPGSYANILSSIVKTAQDHPSINIKDIAYSLYLNDHEKQDALIYSLARHLMELNYRTREDKGGGVWIKAGYNIEEFMEHPLVIHSAEILDIPLQKFATEVCSSLLNPIDIPKHNTLPNITDQLLHEFGSGDYLYGEDYTYKAPQGQQHQLNNAHAIANIRYSKNPSYAGELADDVSSTAQASPQTQEQYDIQLEKTIQASLQARETEDRQELKRMDELRKQKEEREAALESYNQTFEQQNCVRSTVDESKDEEYNVTSLGDDAKQISTTINT